jgi:tRNA A-37 threonylcarbamoyl transferase component Bud32
VKRYRYPTWAQSRGLLGRGTLYGVAPEVQEFKNLEFLREKGVSAVRPVAAASITQGMRLVAHMLMTEDVPGAIDLQKRLDTPGDPVRDDRETRWRVEQLVGRLVYKMHVEGFSHRDLFPRNVLVRVDEDGPAVFVCDCRRGGPPSMRWKSIDDLATLDLDLKGRVSRTDRMRILRSYAGPDGRLAHFAADIVKRRRKRFEAKTA